MLATLERPIAARPVTVPVTRTATSWPSLPPARLHLIVSVPTRLASTAQPAGPVRAAARQSGPPTAAPPLRITVRARRLLAALVLLGCAAAGAVAVDVVAGLGPFSARTSYAAQEAPYAGAQAADGSGGVAPAAGTSITVGAGDTLWSLAERVDPDADPRDVIAAIMILNDLDSSALQAGQVLLLP